MSIVIVIIEVAEYGGLNCGWLGLRVFFFFFTGDKLYSL